MIVDVITYNGEKELFDLRYNILKDYVHEFIVVEFDQTFSGKVKEYKFPKIENKYKNIKYFPINYHIYEQYHSLAISSPNTEYGKGATHWIREFCQKESIKNCLYHLEDNDLVFIGDCDEIWDKTALELPGINKLKLRVYSYFFNNRSDEQFWGTIGGKYKDIKWEILNHLRSNAHKTENIYGWHFTNMGGLDQVRRKLNDSYTKDSYNTDEVQSRLAERFGKTDYLGRDFKFWIDESDWPDYLKLNRNKYETLLNHNSGV